MLEPPGNLDAVRLVRGRMPVAHRYTAGVAGERYFRTLAEAGVFLATRCPACAVTYCPARAFCERCFAELTEEVELGPTGRLVSATTVRIDGAGQPLAAPVAIGLVRLDGADTCVTHPLTAEAMVLAIGAAVEAVLKPGGERTGALSDVIAFRPVNPPAGG